MALPLTRLNWIQQPLKLTGLAGVSGIGYYRIILQSFGSGSMQKNMEKSKMEHCNFLNQVI